MSDDLDLVGRLRETCGDAAAEIERLRADNEKLSRIGIALNRRVADLERDLSIEVAAGHDAVKRAEDAERERDELRAKWEPLVTWAAAKDKADPSTGESNESPS